jgi:hypothetical protein
MRQLVMTRRPLSHEHKTENGNCGRRWGENHVKIYRAHPFCDAVAIVSPDFAHAETAICAAGIKNMS